MSADNGIFILTLKDKYVITESTLSVMDDLFYDESIMVQEVKMVPSGIKKVFNNYLCKCDNYKVASKIARNFLKKIDTEYGIHVIDAKQFSYSEIFS